MSILFHIIILHQIRCWTGEYHASSKRLQVESLDLVICTKHIRSPTIGSQNKLIARPFHKLIARPFNTGQLQCETICSAVMPVSWAMLVYVMLSLNLRVTRKSRKNDQLSKADLWRLEGTKINWESLAMWPKSTRSSSTVVSQMKLVTTIWTHYIVFFVYPSPLLIRFEMLPPHTPRFGENARCFSKLLDPGQVRFEVHLRLERSKSTAISRATCYLAGKDEPKNDRFWGFHA